MKIFGIILLFGIVWLKSFLAEACTVCFGDPNSPLTQSVGWGVWTLIGFIGVVLVLFVVLFFNINKRMKKMALLKS